MITEPVSVRNAPGQGLAGPSVSVVITCFNYGRFLPQSVGSALQQERVSADVIIVDDRSTDDSLVVARRLAEADRRVHVVANARNLGPAGAFNVGWQAARGTYVVRLDADDLLTRNALHRATALLESHPGVVFVYGRPIHFSQNPPELKRTPVGRWRIWPGHEWVDRRCRRGYSCITSPEVTMRRSALEAVGGMHEFAHAHDFDLWLRLGLLGNVGYLAGTVQALHREHADSLSARKVDEMIDLEQRAMAFQNLSCVPAAHAASAASLALRHLAAEALELACREYDKGSPDERVVVELVNLAHSCSRTYQDLPQWRALRRRRRLGVLWTKRSGLGAARSLRRRILSDHARLRWRLTGQ